MWQDMTHEEQCDSVAELRRWKKVIYNGQVQYLEPDSGGWYIKHKLTSWHPTESMFRSSR